MISVIAVIYGIVAGFCADFILRIIWGSSIFTLGVDLLVCAIFVAFTINTISGLEENHGGLKRAEKK